MKLNLKVLYFLTLGALCLYVTSGPASASIFGPPQPAQMINMVAGPGTTTGDGTLGWTGLRLVGDNTTSAEIYATASCTGTVSCSGALPFSFNVFSYSEVVISLIGTSGDSGATGDVAFYRIDPSNPASGFVTTQLWTVDGQGNIVMKPFTVIVPGSDGAYFGEFYITNLAPGASLELPIGFGVPEPGSALLLGAGLALVEFLRRKIRR